MLKSNIQTYIVEDNCGHKVESWSEGLGLLANVIHESLSVSTRGTCQQLLVVEVIVIGALVTDKGND